MIANTRDGEWEEILPTGREREAEATKMATNIALTIMYRVMFQIYAKLDDIAEFIWIRSSEEHAKVAMMHSSYGMQTGKVVSTRLATMATTAIWKIWKIWKIW